MRGGGRDGTIPSMTPGMGPRPGRPRPSGRQNPRQSRRRSRLPLAAAVTAVLAGAALIGASFALGDPPPPVDPAPVTTGPPTPPGPTGPRELTVIAGGDILIHPPVWEQAQADASDDGFDFYPIFAGLAPAISAADLAICHLETPVSAPEGPFLGWPRFSAPPQLLTALVDVGYHACSTASNHTLDQGEEGVYRTIDALVDHGLGWAGSARTPQEAAEPTLLEVSTGDGRVVTVGHLSYTFAFNGPTRPPGKEWLANLTDIDAILAEARLAREHGAEVVLVSMHWGEEYQVEPTSIQQEQAEQLLASADIDLILGHHAHVVQPVERIADKWVAYGVGNQLARHAEPIDAQREGAMIHATLTEQDDRWRVTALEAIPTWVELEPQIRLVDLSAALAGDDLTEPQRSTYQQAYDRITTSLRARDATELVVR